MSNQCQEEYDLGPNALRILGLILSSNPGKRCTVRGIAKEMGFTVNGANWHLKRLRRLGLIDRAPMSARTIRPTCQFSEI